MIGGEQSQRVGEQRAPRPGLLFDLDGTLVQAEHLHLAAFRDIVAHTGRTLSDEDFVHHVSGRSNDAIMTYLFPAADLDERRALADRKEASWRSLAVARGVDATPGAVHLIAWARERGIATGLVTNAPRPNAELMVELLGLRDAFELVITADEIPRGKPHPDPYLTAVEQMGLAATTTVAIEDSLPGIAAARSAGLGVVAYVNASTAAAVQGSGAHLVVDDLGDARLFEYLERTLALQRAQ